VRGVEQVWVGGSRPTRSSLPPQGAATGIRLRAGAQVE